MFPIIGILVSSVLDNTPAGKAFNIKVSSVVRLLVITSPVEVAFGLFYPSNAGVAGPLLNQ